MQLIRLNKAKGDEGVRVKAVTKANNKRKLQPSSEESCYHIMTIWTPSKPQGQELEVPISTAGVICADSN